VDLAFIPVKDGASMAVVGMGVNVTFRLYNSLVNLHLNIPLLNLDI